MKLLKKQSLTQSDLVLFFYLIDRPSTLQVDNTFTRHFATLTPYDKLIAICPLIQSKLDTTKTEFSYRTYTDYETILNKEKNL